MSFPEIDPFKVAQPVASPFFAATQIAKEESALHISLQKVIQLIGENNLAGAAEECKKISQVYTKNIGHLLISLAYLRGSNVKKANGYLHRVQLSPNLLDPSCRAKMAVKQLLDVAGNASSPVFSAEQKDEILDKLGARQNFIMNAIVETFHEIEGKAIAAAPAVLQPKTEDNHPTPAPKFPELIVGYQSSADETIMFRF